MARPVELGGRREARGAGPHDRDLLPRPLRRRLGDDPPHLEALVHDRLFDALDRDRVAVDPQDAGTLARGGADAAGELRKIVRLVEPLEGVVPLLPEDQVVPVGDQVVDGAARGHAPQHRPGVAERDAAVHAPRALLAERLRGQVVVELAPVRRALGGRPVLGCLPSELHEPRRLPHSRRPPGPGDPGSSFPGPRNAPSPFPKKVILLPTPETWPRR
jgi:hypothetical protein